MCRTSSRESLNRYLEQLRRVAPPIINRVRWMRSICNQRPDTLTKFRDINTLDNFSEARTSRQSLHPKSAFVNAILWSEIWDLWTTGLVLRIFLFTRNVQIPSLIGLAAAFFSQKLPPRRPKVYFPKKLILPVFWEELFFSIPHRTLF